MDKPTKADYLNRLNNITDPVLIYWDDFDIALCGSVVMNHDGTYYMMPVENTYDGGFTVSVREYRVARSLIDQGRHWEREVFGADGSDANVIELVEAGCEPGIPYYRYESHAERGIVTVHYGSEEGIREVFIANMITLGHFTPWKYFKKRDLAHFCQYLDFEYYHTPITGELIEGIVKSAITPIAVESMRKSIEMLGTTDKA